MSDILTGAGVTLTIIGGSALDSPNIWIPMAVIVIGITIAMLGAVGGKKQ